MMLDVDELRSFIPKFIICWIGCAGTVEPIAVFPVTNNMEN